MADNDRGEDRAEPEVRYWMGDVPGFDDFGQPIKEEFIDGKTTFGPWGFMTPTSYKTYGIGRLGTGYGQRYQKQPNGRWKKVEG